MNTIYFVLNKSIDEQNLTLLMNKSTDIFRLQSKRACGGCGARECNTNISKTLHHTFFEFIFVGFSSSVRVVGVEPANADDAFRSVRDGVSP
jgi:hypothetical protein